MNKDEFLSLYAKAPVRKINGNTLPWLRLGNHLIHGRRQDEFFMYCFQCVGEIGWKEISFIVDSLTNPNCIKGHECLAIPYNILSIIELSEKAVDIII